MAFPAYSTRFWALPIAPGGGFTIGYTVPLGKRMVLKCTASWTNSVSGGSLHYYLAGLPWDNVRLEAAGSLIRNELQIVLNEGEELQIYSELASWYSTGSGYLLDA